VNRGEVWRLVLDQAGGEEGGSRLVILLSNDALAVLPLRVVVPLVAWREAFAAAPWMVRVPPVLNSGLTEVMAADALQVRSVSTARLTQRLGSLPERVTAQLSTAVGEVIG
jgi:mRNA-degrading endonuclease toxin of MazEF toxin-antitoxin module